jgi:glycosyltransferase involved in cell wall biosynthesis
MTAAKGLKLLLTADAVGGVWQYAVELAAALRPHGVRTVLAVLGPAPSAEQRAEAQAIPGLQLVETGLPLDWLSDGPAPVLAAGGAISDLARRERVDLVHLNMPTLGAAAPPGVPVVAATHGCVSTWWQAAKPGVPLDRGFRWHRALMAEGLRAADLVVAPSASYARLVGRHYGLPHMPAVVHNGRTRPAPAATGALQPEVLTVGRLWDRVKRADLLDRVAARLPVPLRAAGAVRGPHGETIDLPHLALLGQVDGATLAGELASRPIFVSAACFEPFGLAVLEAASAGCALVLSDIPTFRELWDGAALFVAADDEAAYADAIEQLLADEALRLSLGAAARERAGRYTPAAMAENMLRLYGQLLATAGVKAA